MPNVSKVLGQVAPSATTLTTVYTVPVTVGSFATVSSATICNRSSSAGSFRIAVIPYGTSVGSQSYLYYDLPIDANDTFVATIGITLSENDVVQVYASHANMTFQLYGVEYEPSEAEVPTAVVLSGFREVLAANRTYYVRTNGSDTNSGLVDDAAGAFLTVAKAVSVVLSIDNNGYQVIIKIADGTYTQTSNTVLTEWVGSAVPIIRGNTTTPANVVLTTSTNGVDVFYCTSKKRWHVEGVSMAATGTSGCCARLWGGYMSFSNSRFGVATESHIRGYYQSTVLLEGTITLYGNTPNFIALFWGGVARFAAFGDYATLVFGSITVSDAFVWGYANAVISIVSYQSGSFTGKRYAADRLAMIDSGGNGTTYLPGTVAGTTSVGGQYG